MAEAWAKLSLSDKNKWDELAAAKAKEYKQKVLEWETEMVSKGFLEIHDVNENKKKNDNKKKS